MKRRGDESGFAMLLVFAMAAAVAIVLYTELPRAAFEAQRHRELLLIDRGEQYQRAIQLYFRKFRRFPGDLDQLENTNNIRFLRRRYKDPVTGKDEWRLIHIGPGGMLTDSLTQKPPELKTGEEKTEGSTEAAKSGSGSPELPSAATRRRASEMGGPGLPGSMPPGAVVEPGAQSPPGLAGQPAWPTQYTAYQPGQPAVPGQYPVYQPGQPTVPGQYPVYQPGQPVAPGQYPVYQPGQPPVPGQYPVYQPGQPGVPGQPGEYPQPQPGQPDQPAQTSPPEPGQEPQVGVPYVVPGQGASQPGVYPIYQPGQPTGYPSPQPGQPAPVPFPVVQPGQPYPVTQPGQPYPTTQPIQLSPYPQGQPGQFPSYPPGQPYPPSGIPQAQPYPPQGSVQIYPGQPGQPPPGFIQGLLTPGSRPGVFTPTIPQQQPPSSSQTGGESPRPYPQPSRGGTSSPYQRTAQPSPGTGPSNPALEMIRKLLTSPRPGGLGQPGVQQTFTFGAGIAGVASKAEADSIIIYNDRARYNEWEFIYDLRKDRTMVGPIAPTGGPAGNLLTTPAGSSATTPPMNPAGPPVGPGGRGR